MNNKCDAELIEIAAKRLSIPDGYVSLDYQRNKNLLKIRYSERKVVSNKAEIKDGVFYDYDKDNQLVNIELLDFVVIPGNDEEITNDSVKRENYLQALKDVFAMLSTAENLIVDKNGNRLITMLYAQSLVIKLKLTEDFVLVNDSIKAYPLKKHLRDPNASPKPKKKKAKSCFCGRARATYSGCPEHNNFPRTKIKTLILKRLRYYFRKTYYGTARKLGFDV